MYSNSVEKSAGELKTPLVNKSLNDLERQVQALLDLSMRLTERLEQICTPEYPAPVSTQQSIMVPVSPKCGLSDRIDAYTDQAFTSANRLQSILNRLEI